MGHGALPQPQALQRAQGRLGPLSGRRILVVVGLAAEARIAAGPTARVVIGATDHALLSARLEVVDPATVTAVVSFGLAGALEFLPVGSVVVATGIVAAATDRLEPLAGLDGRPRPQAEVAGAAGLRRARSRRASVEAPADGGAPQDEEAWTSARLPETRCDVSSSNDIAMRLQRGGLTVRRATVFGSDAPLMSADDKRRAGQESGAAIVDMESHLAAAWATAHGKPLLAIRVVSDGAGRTLPPAAGLQLRRDGSPDLPAVLRSVLARPNQIPALVRTGLEAGRALATLRRVRGLLGPGLGLDL